MSRCAGCEVVHLTGADGEPIDAVALPDPDCPVHGLPKTWWPPGHPLRRHARLVERETGRTLTVEQARAELGVEVDGGGIKTEHEWFEYRRRFREETPRETERRLYAEATA